MLEIVSHYSSWTQQAIEELNTEICDKDAKSASALILELCTLLYFLDCRRTASWNTAGGYALQNLPPMWRPLIHEALCIGCDPSGVTRGGDRPLQTMKEDARSFAAFFIEYVNREYGLFYTH